MKTTKLICTDSFYYNLTKPYYYFKKGEIYEAKVNYINREYMKEHLTKEKIIYSFAFCDLLFTSNMGINYFKTLEEWRNEQLKKLNI